MIKYKGGDGSNKEKAIIISGAESEFEGVDAEYNYLDSKLGEYELVSQDLLDEGDNQYDVLNIKLHGSEEKEVWFDITDFYGK